MVSTLRIYLGSKVKHWLSNREVKSSLINECNFTLVYFNMPYWRQFCFRKTFHKVNTFSMSTQKICIRIDIFVVGLDRFVFKSASMKSVQKKQSKVYPSVSKLRRVQTWKYCFCLQRFQILRKPFLLNKHLHFKE